MRSVLVTGGAGFIGHNLADHLGRHGWEVISVDALAPQVHQDPAESRRRLAGRLIEADITDDDAFDAVGAVSAVVHLAAETGVGQSMYEVDRYRRVNVEGTARVARWCARRSVPLVFFSSRAVYGEGRHECAIHGDITDGTCCASTRPVASREQDPVAPVSVYGQTKVDGEQLLAEGAAGDAPVTILRPQNVIGAGQALHNPYTGVLAAFLARLKEGRPVQIYGDGTATRDFVHVGDVVRLVAALLEDPPPAGPPRVLNCGSGVRTSLTELAQYAIAGAPVPGTVEYVDVQRAGDIRHACADTSRLVALGLPTARVSTADAVAEFIGRGWDEPGVSSKVWDDALEALSRRGLAR